MSPKIYIICEKEKQEIGLCVRQKLDDIGYDTEIHWQEDEGFTGSLYNAAGVVVCVSSSNYNNLHLVPEIERSAYAQIPIIAVLIDQDFDPNDQEWLSITEMIRASTVVDFNRANEFECYFEELHIQWTRNMLEKEELEKQTDVKDKDFETGEKEEDDNDRNEDKEDNWKDGEDVDEDATLTQTRNEDKDNNESEVEKEDATGDNASGDDKHLRVDEDIEKGHKEDTEEDELEKTDAANDEDKFSREDIAHDGSTAPHEDVPSTEDTHKDETTFPNENIVKATVPNEDIAPADGTAPDDDIAHEEGSPPDKDISTVDGCVPDDDVTPVELTEHDAIRTWAFQDQENCTAIKSNTELLTSGEGILEYTQTEQKEKLEDDLFQSEGDENSSERKHLSCKTMISS